MGAGGEFMIVGDEHECSLDILVQFDHEVDDLVARICIQIASGLVGKEDFGPIGERAGQGDPLLFATG